MDPIPQDARDRRPSRRRLSSQRSRRGTDRRRLLQQACVGCSGACGWSGRRLGGAGVDRSDDGADFDGVALRRGNLEHSRSGRAQFKRRLVGLDLGEEIVLLDIGAVGQEPTAQRNFGDGFAGRIVMSTAMSVDLVVLVQSGANHFCVDFSLLPSLLASLFMGPPAGPSPALAAPIASVRILSCSIACCFWLPTAGLAESGRPM